MTPAPPFIAPWLTVIMPLHSGERWIEAALDSLAAEADGGVEVLLLDSSPTSATLDLARRYSSRLAMRIVEDHDLVMWHAKTNFAVRAARTDHVCWLHQDDLWLPGRAAAVRAWIAEAPQAVLHLSPSAIVDGAGRTIGVWRCPFAREGEIDTTVLLERLLVQNFVAAPAAVYRKDAWLAVRGMDEQLWYTSDWDVWLKLAAHGPVRYHNSVTAAFRVHGSSQTVAGSRDAVDFERQMRIVLDRHVPRLGTHAARVRRAGLASISVNRALAAAAAGDLRGLAPAVGRILALGPFGIRRYLRDSRIIERVVPRLRARLAGSF